MRMVGTVGRVEANWVRVEAKTEESCSLMEPESRRKRLGWSTELEIASCVISTVSASRWHLHSISTLSPTLLLRPPFLLLGSPAQSPRLPRSSSHWLFLG